MAVDGEQGRAGARHVSVLHGQGTAGSLGLPPKIWMGVIKPPGETCKANWSTAPHLISAGACFFPSQGQPSLPSPLYSTSGSGRVGGLGLHLLVEIALTFICICWPNCYPVPEAECGYTFLLKLACLV